MGGKLRLSLIPDFKALADMVYRKVFTCSTIGALQVRPEQAVASMAYVGARGPAVPVVYHHRHHHD